MVVFKVIIGFMILISFVLSLFKLNAYSEEKYHYVPIQGFNIILGFIPWVLVMAGNYGQIHGEDKSLALGVMFALFFAYGMVIYIAKQSSLKIALAAVAIILVVNILIVLIAMGIEMSRNNNYYYDDD